MARRPYRSGGWLGKSRARADNAMFGSSTKSLMQENRERERLRQLEESRNVPPVTYPNDKPEEPQGNDD